ncbi:MAG: ATP-binding cassette domain-containing protein [Deltaproteobacteria bacterium]|nr:ATP-binding cassette domain-containing protein [Deltaproteobacteria bacterium]
MIELRGVARRYGEEVALEPTDLAIARGQTTVLIGPSGCGKSTLLRTIIGLVAPDTGEVIFDGVRVDAASVRAVRRRTGYVIQDGGLFPHLSAADNVALMARHLGWDAPRRQARLDELAALVRLPRELLGRPPGALSGGQRQRVSLMRALMLDPEALLLDEPLGALDPMVRIELQDDLRAIFATLGKTVVMVTHDLAEAAFFADRVVLMRAGAIVQAGAVADLERAPADEFVTRFLRAQRRGFGGAA